MDELMHAYLPKQSGALSDWVLILCGKQCRMTPHAALLAESLVTTWVVKKQGRDIVMVKFPVTLRLDAE